MGKYEENCIEMYLREDNPPRPGRAGTFIFGQEYKGQDYFKDARNMVEFMPITGNYMMMNGFPKGFERKVYDMGDHKGGPYPKYNRGCDKLMIWYGTDPKDLNDLGAHVEFHLGEGADEEVFHFDEPRCVFVPKGVRYGPIYITKFRRVLMLVNVYTVISKEAADIEDAWDYVGDDAKMREVIGDDIALYRSFYGKNPATPLNPSGEHRDGKI
jgi:hypothetical protein